MTNEQLADMLMRNEPYFLYNGVEYSICSPDGKFYATSENALPDSAETFSTVDDLLDHWIIQGKPFREVLPQTDLADWT